MPFGTGIHQEIKIETVTRFHQEITIDTVTRTLLPEQR
jgi:hypothetical protein